MTSDGSPGSLERSERSQGLGPAAATRSGARRARTIFASGARRREAPARRRRGWSSARQPSLRWAESQRVCSSTKSSTREEGRANAGSRPDAVATNSDDVSATLFGVFFAAGLSSCAVRIFATPGGVPTRLFTHRKHFQVTMGLTPRHPPTAGVRFFPLEPSEPSGTAKRPGSLAAPPPAPLLPAPPRDGALRAAPRNLADARAPPLVHRARTSPATRRPPHRRTTRRTGRPVRPRGHRGRLRAAFARGRRVLRRAPRAQRRAVLLSRALPHPPPAATECARPRSRQRSQKVWGEHACRRPVSVRRPSGASSTTRAPLPDATPTATRPSTSTGTSTPRGRC